MPRQNNPKQQLTEPTVAPGLEMDELEEGATEEEIAKGDYTVVTSLVIDRVPETEEE